MLYEYKIRGQDLTINSILFLHQSTTHEGAPRLQIPAAEETKSAHQKGAEIRLQYQRPDGTGTSFDDAATSAGAADAGTASPATR